MLKQILALLIMTCLLPNGSGVCYARASMTSADPSSAKPKDIAKIKKKAVNAGINSKVRVNLRNGEKIEGRVIEITDRELVVQLLTDDQVTSRRLDFSTITNLREVKGPSPALLGAIGAVAGLIIAGVVIGVIAGIAGNR
ncbi:MAG: hypothetical protein HYR55_10830 [Acidobacteria bacterium]|nr:hypothetical protein [Acidobacteriota bacterium]MBI3655650.1 hypothetical protein [Acidobacteriota bacterium]